MGRATWLPFVSPDESTILHLGAGYRFSNGKEGFVTGSKPEFDNAPDFVATEFFDINAMDTYQAELSLRRGPLWFHSEYIRSDLDSADYDDPSFSGYHLTASWITTGEMRSYNKRVGIFGGIPIARNVNQNGWGAWEVGGRFSHLDLSDGGVDGGEMDIWSASATWLLSPYFNIFFDYRYITLDRFGIEGTSHGFNTRLMLVLE